MPVRFYYDDRAEIQVEDLYLRLKERFSVEIADRFLVALQSALAKEALFVEVGRRALARESQGVRRDLYPLVVHGSGVWRVLYELRDQNEDGQIDALAVYSVVGATRRNVRP